MSWILEIPSWMGTALVSVFFAVFGFVIRELIQRRKAKKLKMATNISRLKIFSRMLWLQNRIFQIQCEHRNQLFDLLISKYDVDGGYEEVFTILYDKFSPEEKQIHRHIRGITETSMFQINKQVQNIVRDIDTENIPIISSKQIELAEKMKELDLHLMLWFATFDYYIPENPKHALVYLGDERGLGVKYPSGLDELVNEVLKEIQ